jgi:hypothetical protein
LIGGRHDATDAALEALRAVFRPNVASWNAGATLPLPLDGGVRTLILHDVDALSPDEQRRLLHWLAADAAAVQVVATTGRALWPLVESGSFNASLYYALNLVHLRL